jgi:hypothetical protein
MRDEVLRLLATPAKYIDSRLGEEPTSGKPLFLRFAEVCDHVRADAPALTPSIPSRNYKPDEAGSFRRNDLVSLLSDINAVLSLIPTNS